MAEVWADKTDNGFSSEVEVDGKVAVSFRGTFGRASIVVHVATANGVYQEEFRASSPMSRVAVWAGTLKFEQRGSSSETSTTVEVDPIS